MTRTEFLERAREKHGYKYTYPSLSETVKYSDYIDVEHSGILYKQRVSKHITLGRSPEKTISRKTTDQFILEARQVWGDRYDYSISEYLGASEKIKIIFKGVVLEQTASHHLRGISPEKTLNRDNFIRKSLEKHGDRYDYSLVDFIDGRTPVCIIYQGQIFWQKPYSHLSGNRPENLKNSTRKTNDLFISESQLIHDKKFTYDNTNYLSNHQKVAISCPIHGDFEQTPTHHLRGHGCPSCGCNKTEQEITEFLKSHNLNYNKQHKFVNCRIDLPLPFDFYVPSARTCVEIHGEHHYQPMGLFGGTKSFQWIRDIDKAKSDFCEENYINLIVVRENKSEDLQSILWHSFRSFISQIYRK